jgi:non-specific serine/threonine protein kinase
MKTYILVFDLAYNADLKYHIPRACIAGKENDLLGYIVKSANTQTLDSYQIVCDEVSKELMLLCQKLHPNTLHKKYNEKNKVAKPLSFFLNDGMFKRLIIQHIETSLEKFLHLISKTTIPLSINLEKGQRFEKRQVFFSNTVLEPKLYFNKLEAVLEYRLSLFDGENELIPSQQKFEILFDDPPFIVYNKKIVSLKYINANKLIPFLNKEVIKIPKRSSVEYFNKFIKKVIKKAPIEAKGFEVITYNTCKSCIIKPTSTIYSKVYHLELYFVYKNHSFSIVDSADKYIQLKHDDVGEFTVLETARNKEQEQKFISVLNGFGLQFLDNKLATFNTNINEIDTFFNISKLIKLKEALNSESIEVDFELHKLKINDKLSTISSQYIEKNDWFDVEMTIDVGGFQFPFTELVSNLKSGERLYELPDGSHFLIPFEWYSRYKSLINLGKSEKDAIKIQKNQFTVLQEAEIATPEEISKDILPYKSTGNLQASLRNYQKEGVNWLAKNYQMSLGSCLADDMGLGKTIQTLAYLDFVYTCFKEDFNAAVEPEFPLDLFSSLAVTDKKLKALVVSPSSLTFNWYNETRKFCPHFSCLSYVGKDRARLQKEISKVDVVFTSYGTLLRDIEFLKSMSFNFIIIDESQQIKNRNSKIYKAINSIDAKHKVSLSGTPIENSLSDLWSQMQFINPNLLGNYPFFNSHFKKPIEKDKDEEKVNELKSLIDPYLLRRNKAEVAKDLPELAEQIYYTELAPEQAKLYEVEKSKVRNQIIESKLHPEKNKNAKLSILNALMKLRQLANHPKLIKNEAKSGKFADVSAYLETLLRSKHKTLVFSSFTTHLKIYTDWCDQNNIKYNLLTGQTKVKDREKEVDYFENNSDSLLFFISLKAGGTGLNLTSASYVIILDPWWNPFAELQAIGRAHRIGQKQNVNVVRFIAKETIEEKINTLQQTKRELADSVIESQITSEVMLNLDAILE